MTRIRISILVAAAALVLPVTASAATAPVFDQYGNPVAADTDAPTLDASDDTVGGLPRPIDLGFVAGNRVQRHVADVDPFQRSGERIEPLAGVRRERGPWLLPIRHRRPPGSRRASAARAPVARNRSR